MAEPKWVQESFKPMFELARYFGTYLKEQQELYYKYKDNEVLKKSIAANLENYTKYQTDLFAEIQKLVFMNAGTVKDITE